MTTQKMTEEEAIRIARKSISFSAPDSANAEAIRTVCDALEGARKQAPVAYEISHESPADIPHYKGADVFTADKIAAYESHGFTVRALTYASAPAQPAPETAGDALDGLVIHTPLPVFSDGPWIFIETGQRFTGDELNIEAFTRYRNALLAAPVPYGFAHLPQVATEDMQDNMRAALIDQGWTSDSAGEVDFQDIWDAAVIQFVESAEDAYAAILAAQVKS